MKRISVIVSSIIIFQTPVQPVNALGAAIAVLGTFLYSQVICHLPLYGFCPMLTLSEIHFQNTLTCSNDGDLCLALLF